MKRTQIYLTKIQDKNLKDNTKKTGMSASELIRRLLDSHFEKDKQAKDDTK